MLLPALLVVIVPAPSAWAQTYSPAPTSAAQNGSPAQSFREVVDETGRTVRIPQPVMRIVSLAPSLTETVYALGLQDRLVGDTDYCDYPPEAQKKQKVGGAINPSLEEIAHLRPDVVLVTKHLNTLDTVHSLDALGIPSYATDPRNVDEIVASTKRLGRCARSAGGWSCAGGRFATSTGCFAAEDWSAAAAPGAVCSVDGPADFDWAKIHLLLMRCGGRERFRS